MYGGSLASFPGPQCCTILYVEKIGEHGDEGRSLSCSCCDGNPMNTSPQTSTYHVMIAKDTDTKIVRM